MTSYIPALPDPEALDISNISLTGSQALDAAAQTGFHGNVSDLFQMLSTAVTMLSRSTMKPPPSDPWWTQVEAEQPVLGPLEYRYALISRGDTEALIWFLRYTYCGLVVPILLITEVSLRGGC